MEAVHQISEQRTVQQMLAKYTRAADALDGAAVIGLFTPDGKVEVYYAKAGVPKQLFVRSGRAEFADFRTKN